MQALPREFHAGPLSHVTYPNHLAKVNTCAQPTSKRKPTRKKKKQKKNKFVLSNTPAPSKKRKKPALSRFERPLQ